MRIHFIGIGGIGVSALVYYYLEQGNHKISGSDLESSEITEALKKKGVKIIIGRHKSKNLPKNTDLVVYSPAVRSDNLELKEAKKRKIKVRSYPQVLGELTKKHFTIAVSGTHGKSTTTAMIGLILTKAGFDPTVIVGTKLREFKNTNCRVGKSKFLVIEADEWQASFLNYWPKIIVLTNIEEDHLDYFKNIRNIIKVYRKYINHLPKDGFLVTNKLDRNISKIKSQKPKLQFNIQNFSVKEKETEKLRKILKIPGEHNVANALAALKTARILKIPDNISFETLSKYRGAWRRFEERDLKIKNKVLRVINDYAHHPTEIKVTLKAAREKYPNQKICCVFEPHQYQRTYYLFKDFVKTFKENPVDLVIITDIYDVAGREKKKIKKGVSSKKLVQAIERREIIYLPLEKIVYYLKKNFQRFKVLLIMGAGDIYKLEDKLKLKY